MADTEPACESDPVFLEHVADGEIRVVVDGEAPISLTRGLQVNDTDGSFSIHGCAIARGDQYYVTVGWLVSDRADFNFTESGGPEMFGRIYRCPGGDTCLHMEPDWLFRTDDLLGLRPDRVDGTVFLSERDRGRANGYFTVHQFDHVTEVDFDVRWQVSEEM